MTPLRKVSESSSFGSHSTAIPRGFRSFNSSSDEFVQLKPTSYGNGFVPIYDYGKTNAKVSRENRLKFLKHEALAHQTNEVFNSLAKDSYQTFPRHRPRKHLPSTFSNLRMEGVGHFMSETRSQYGSPFMKLFHLGNSRGSNSPNEIHMVESVEGSSDAIDAEKSESNSILSSVGGSKPSYYTTTSITTHR
ncbi:uncharacterized protein LOC131886844 [Tigriopus californicus]|uniref:uncharacterized protein LOC131886844 n=1 Tax=Tigriopus californicus TaxID=6832 RepID=UPI0027D9D16B|nr:uncharacterized protein LOC131886844 [Tigriopus californicus]